MDIRKDIKDAVEKVPADKKDTLIHALIDVITHNKEEMDKLLTLKDKDIMSVIVLVLLASMSDYLDRNKEK